MPSDGTQQTADPSGRAAPPALRLSLDPTGAHGGVVDGGWWPRSWDATAELPDLIAGLGTRVGAIVRVQLNLDAWGDAPRRLTVAGRIVRVGRFRTIDRQLISISGAAHDRIALLVVPPEATATTAEALAMAADQHDSGRPADLLTHSGIAVQDSTPSPTTTRR